MIMKNIFGNTHFGKLYKTRDGRKAVCDGIIEGLPYFSIEGYTNSHGIIYLGGDKEITYLTPWLEEELKGCGDIVSEWNEEINTEELNKLATEYMTEERRSIIKGACDLSFYDLEFAFKAGYRKAKET